jgi:hypothetical protein
MASENKSKRQEMYDIVVDYSGYSTLAGLIYIFMPEQPMIGKVQLMSDACETNTAQCSVVLLA